MSDDLTTLQTERALSIVAAWLGPRMGYAGPAPTGREESRRGTGPFLNPEWDWPSSGPVPTILLEGGPEDWAVVAASNESVVSQLRDIGIFAEPWASYALCLYPA
jgi:hypothetical protein